MPTTPTRPNRRRRALALVVAASAPLLLGGCTIIGTLQGGGADGPAEEQDVIGDVPADLRPFYEQELDWSPCGNHMQCATATAPMNWADPSSPEIELALVKLEATGEKLGSLFTNPGGPGASGVDFVTYGAQSVFEEPLREHYDIVGWDPRGVGASSAVDCLDDAGLDEYFYGPTPPPASPTDAQIVEAATAQAQAFATACQENTGELLGFVDTSSTVHDLDLLRALVGDPKLNYIGFSYGTDIGARYVDTYPQKAGRVVLDGATDPTLTMFEVILGQQKGFGEAARAWLEDCGTGPSCPFTGSVDDAIAEINGILEKVDAAPPRAADGRYLTSSVITRAISQALYSADMWPTLTQAFASYRASGDVAGFFALSDAYYGRGENGVYESNMFEAFAAINCLDYPVERDPAAIAAFNEQLEAETPIGVPGPKELGDVTCQEWPYESTSTLEPVTGAGADPVLVVGTTGDPATPYAWAEALAGQLESAELITYEGEGHVAYTQGDACVNDAVNAYLVDGTVPAGGLTC